jgi:hypothetical protein
MEICICRLCHAGQDKYNSEAYVKKMNIVLIDINGIDL